MAPPALLSPSRLPKLAASWLLFASILPFLLPFLSVVLLFFLPLGCAFLFLAHAYKLSCTLFPYSSHCASARRGAGATDEGRVPGASLKKESEEHAEKPSAVELPAVAASSPLSEAPDPSSSPQERRWASQHDETLPFHEPMQQLTVCESEAQTDVNKSIFGGTVSSDADYQQTTAERGSEEFSFQEPTEELRVCAPVPASRGDRPYPSFDIAYPFMQSSLEAREQQEEVSDSSSSQEKFFELKGLNGGEEGTESYDRQASGMQSIDKLQERAPGFEAFEGALEDRSEKEMRPATSALERAQSRWEREFARLLDARHSIPQEGAQEIQQEQAFDTTESEEMVRNQNPSATEESVGTTDVDDRAELLRAASGTQCLDPEWQSSLREDTAALPSSHLLQTKRREGGDESHAETSSCSTSALEATLEDKQEDIQAETSSCSSSASKAITEPIGDTQVNGSEAKMLLDINAIEKIVGYHGDPHVPLVEQIRALYIFVGMEPSGVSTDLEMARAELQLLKQVVGIK